ncbi:Mov34/MPN/PAD-1 family protein [Candidatus Peregrinibacteria bacterium]|nr:Mov34/MPN/PAD-1 family protein [Candidatus Peregrinibacteria bacterium]
MPDKITITRYAYTKMHLYAKLIKSITESPLECYGYLTAERDKDDGIATDAIIPVQQYVTTSSCTVNPDSELRTIEQIRSDNRKIIGWWHSHGDHPTFHSTTDVENFSRLSSMLYSHNQLTVETERVQWKETEHKAEWINNDSRTLRIRDPQNLDRVIEIEIEETRINQPNVKNITSKRKIKKGFAYSVVVNSLDEEPYGEIKQESSEDTIVEPKIVIVDDDRRVRTKEIREICNDIRGKIKSDIASSNPPPERLEEILNEIDTNHHQISASSKNRTTKLEQRIKYKDLNYTKAIRKFYISETKSIARIAKILSGDFYQDNKRTYFWKDRITEVRKVMKDTKYSVADVDMLSRIIKRNRYASRRYRTQIEDIFLKLKCQT